MSRPEPSDVRLVACVGAGTIGAGWAAYFLAHGLDVVATDPAADGEAKLWHVVDMAWRVLSRVGVPDGASRSRLRFTTDLREAVSQADFIQENAPDREPLKIELFEEIDSAARPDVVIASSSSKFLPSRIASRCRRAERCLVAHPYAPAYLMPLVELVGGAQTSSDSMDWAEEFYQGIGKHVVRLRRETESYVANRIQRAVSREVQLLVEQGICTYEEADRAMCHGPGLRWAFAGPLLCAHLGGGQQGLRGRIAHLGWLGGHELELRAEAEIEQLAGHLTMDEMEMWRDDNLLAMMEALKALPRSADRKHS